MDSVEDFVIMTLLYASSFMIGYGFGQRDGQKDIDKMIKKLDEIETKIKEKTK